MNLRTIARTVVVIYALAWGWAAQARGQCSDTWSPGSGVPGIAGAVCTAVFDDGSGPALYFGGSMTSAGRVPARGLVKWDGTAFHPVGDGTPLGPDGSVGTMVVYHGELVVAGYFTSAGGVPARNIATWNGSRWAALGAGVDSSVKAMTVYQDHLVVGGSFYYVEGQPYHYLAQWDGAAWSAMGPLPNNWVYAATVYNNDLIIAGMFSGLGTGQAHGIARWNGSTWSPVGSPFAVSGSDDYYALTSYNGSLIVGGYFTTVTPPFLNGIARWDGSAWSALGTGTTFTVNGLTAFGGELWAAGNFSTMGGTSAVGIARWNGSQWRSAGDFVGGANVFASWNNNLYFLGYGSSGPQPLWCGRWDGAAWSPLAGGTDGRVLMSTHDAAGHLVAGGVFSSIEGTLAKGVAVRDASGWHALGPGIDGWVQAGTVYNGELVVGGQFQTAGGAPASNIARWDGAAWHPLAAGVDGSVENLAVYNGDLYACGWIGNAGGVSVNRIARWNGSTWSALRNGLQSASNPLSVTAYTMAVFNDQLVVGGNFDIVDGVYPTNHIAAWNGSAWSGVGPTGVNNGVSGNGVLALVVQDALNVAGTFGSAGGVPATNVARWDGNSWYAVGDWQFGMPFRLCAHAGKLYAGGDYPYSVSVFDGTSWNLLPAGPNGRISALASDGDDLIIGGEFQMDSPVVSAYIARWHTPFAPAITSQPSDVFPPPGAPAAFTVAATGSATLTYQWFANDAPLGGATQPSYSIPAASDADAGLYRCDVTNECGTVGTRSARLVLCYANCDNSSITPVLNASDFACFMSRFAAADPYANCDGSTIPPVMNVNDFMCFINAFANGCP